MKPWVELGRARAPGGGLLSLHRRDRDFVLRVDGDVLMSSRQHGSEMDLAAVGCARLGRAPRVLVGGLGMGYTLRAVLDRLPPAGQVVVAEIVPEVVEWNRTVLAELAGRPLADRRATVHLGDVAEAMGAAAAFDAILLDVDNSPDPLTRDANRALYSGAGLAAARRALRPRGCLAVWSAGEAPELVHRLRRAGFAVEVHAARAARGRGSRHVIYAGWSGDGTRSDPGRGAGVG